jgi:hypothetical protein
MEICHKYFIKEILRINSWPSEGVMCESVDRWNPYFNYLKQNKIDLSALQNYIF